MREPWQRHRPEKTMAEKAKPIQDLIQASDAALKDIKKVKADRVKALEEKKEASAAKPKPGGKAGAKAGASSHAIFHELREHCKPIPVVCPLTLKTDKVAWNSPFILRLAEDMQKSISNEACLQQALTDYEKDLARQGQTSRSEITAETLNEAAADAAGRLFEPLFPPSVAFKYMGAATDGAGLKGITQSFTRYIFAVKKGAVTFGSEKFGHPSFRYATSGSRVVVLLDQFKLSEYLGRTGAPLDVTDGVVFRQRLSNFLRKLRQEGIDALRAAGCDIFIGDIGPHQGLYVPSCFFFGEEVQDKAVAGLRFPLLSGDKYTLKSQKHTSESFEKLDKPSDAKAIMATAYVKAVELLKLQEAAD